MSAIFKHIICKLSANLTKYILHFNNWFQWREKEYLQKCVQCIFMHLTFPLQDTFMFVNRFQFNLLHRTEMLISNVFYVYWKVKSLLQVCNKFEHFLFIFEHLTRLSDPETESSSHILFQIYFEIFNLWIYKYLSDILINVSGTLISF